jgi:hypothetical protein
MTKLLTVAIIVWSTVAAYAETYSYSCKVGGKTYPLKVDDTANSLEWKGAKYKLSEAQCGRYGWHAEGNGTPFDFCTATKGYAAIEKDGKLLGACPSSDWRNGGESDSLRGYEQGFSRLED